MDYYTMMSSDNSLPCTQEEFDEIKKLLDDSNESSGISAEYINSKELCIFGEEYADLSYLSDEIIEKIGVLVKKADLPYLLLGFAWFGNRPVMGSCGGTFARIMPDGNLIEPELVWPKAMEAKEKS